MRKKLKYLLALAAVGCMCWLCGGCGIRSASRFYDPEELRAAENAAYQRGVNSALDATMLLDLEQRMTATNRNWGDMAKVVCARLGVKRTEP